MAHTFDPAKMERLTSDDRRAMLDLDRVIAALPLRPYQRVADVGCGSGYFSLPLAKYLYDGILYNIDASEEMLQACRQRLEPFKFSNVQFLQSHDHDVPLDDASLDGVLLAFVLHEVDDRIAFLVKLAEKLVPSGWFALLDWKKKDTEHGPPLDIRLDDAEARSMLAEAGLRSFATHPVGQDYYMIICRR